MAQRHEIEAWVNPSAWDDPAEAERVIDAIEASGSDDEEEWVRLADGPDEAILSARERDTIAAEQSIADELAAFRVAEARLGEAREVLHGAIRRSSASAYRIAQVTGISERHVGRIRAKGKRPPAPEGVEGRCAGGGLLVVGDGGDGVAEGEQDGGEGEQDAEDAPRVTREGEAHSPVWDEYDVSSAGGSGRVLVGVTWERVMRPRTAAVAARMRAICSGLIGRPKPTARARMACTVATTMAGSRPHRRLTTRPW